MASKSLYPLYKYSYKREISDVLDGHGSHLTPQFDRTCAQNNIIPICLPPHSSHLLQPLDVGCFAVLKCIYGRLVEESMRLGINHIYKLDFLAAYPKARLGALKLEKYQKWLRSNWSGAT